MLNWRITSGLFECFAAWVRISIQSPLVELTITIFFLFTLWFTHCNSKWSAFLQLCNGQSFGVGQCICQLKKYLKTYKRHTFIANAIGYNLVCFYFFQIQMEASYADAPFDSLWDTIKGCPKLIARILCHSARAKISHDEKVFCMLRSICTCILHATQYTHFCWQTQWLSNARTDEYMKAILFFRSFYESSVSMDGKKTDRQIL